MYTSNSVFKLPNKYYNIIREGLTSVIMMMMILHQREKNISRFVSNYNLNYPTNRNSAAKKKKR